MTQRRVDTERREQVSMVLPSGWRVAPWFLIRMTGFPFEDIAVLETDVHELCSVDGFTAAIESSIDRLRVTASGERFKEAVFLSNTARHELIFRWIDGHREKPSKHRAYALTCALYLQRFTAKNDTASFFGPCAWGRFRPVINGVMDLDTTNWSEKRRTFFSHWSANAVLESLASNSEEGWVSPRRVPTAERSGDRLCAVRFETEAWIPFETGPLAHETLQVFEFVDGKTSRKELTTRAEKAGIAADDLAIALDELATLGFIEAIPTVPVGLYEPMRYIREIAEAAGDHTAVQDVMQLEAKLQKFETADLVRRRLLVQELNLAFETMTGVNATRGAGKLYADRTVFFEEALHSTSGLTMDPRSLWGVDGMDQAIELLWMSSDVEQLAAQRYAAAWFGRVFGLQDAVPFFQYARAAADPTTGFSEVGHNTQRELQDFEATVYRRLVGNSTEANEVVLSAEDVQDVIDELRPAERLGAILNPDILLAADSLEALNAGQYDVIIGELHADRDLLTHSSFAGILASADQAALADFVAKQYHDACAPDEVPVEVVRTHARKTNGQLLIRMPDLEIQGRSPKGRDQVISASEIIVMRTEGRLRLWSPTLGAFVKLNVSRIPIGSSAITNPMRPFAFPRRDWVMRHPVDAPGSPRISVGRVVIKRRSVSISRSGRAELEDVPGAWSADLFGTYHNLMRELDLGDQVYVKVGGQRKGVFLSFSSYLLVHAFHRLWHRGDDLALFVETLPSTDRWWLEGPGGHYSCELRTGLYRPDPRRIGSE